MNFLENFGIKINNIEILEMALTHTSYSNEHKSAVNYERIEFLGDAVLQLVTSDYFYNSTDYKEGDMTKKRASFVCESALSYYAEKLGFKDLIRVGHGQINNINETIMADIFEAVVGAIYLDQGFDIAKKFIYDVVVPEIKNEKNFFDDYKTLLQEYMQTSKKSVEYVVVSESGEAHNKTFNVEVRINNIVYGKGAGRSKKEAEQKAAKDAYNKSVK